MSITVKIVIPTSGRSETITSHLYVSNCIICVSENEKEKYAAKIKDCEILTHPDAIVGIGMKRQWIYDKFGDVFMMDDDLKGVSRMTTKVGESNQPLTKDLAYAVIQNTANICKMMNCYLFGFNNFVRPEHYHGHEPFKLKGYINGCGDVTTILFTTKEMLKQANVVIHRQPNKIKCFAGNDLFYINNSWLNITSDFIEMKLALKHETGKVDPMCILWGTIEVDGTEETYALDIDNVKLKKMHS